MTTTATLSDVRRAVLHRRIRLIVAAMIGYNVVEAIVAIAAGTIASSVALIGFGLDSTIEVLSAALDSTGHPDVPIGVRLIGSEESADRWGFAGSPTILVDGIDPFPSGTGTRSLACRLYPTPDGLAGHPTRGQLGEAVASHA